MNRRSHIVYMPIYYETYLYIFGALLGCVVVDKAAAPNWQMCDTVATGIHMSGPDLLAVVLRECWILTGDCVLISRRFYVHNTSRLSTLLGSLFSKIRIAYA